ncbi:MAG: phosphoglycerate dehydrogenase [Bacteroidetes bacterium]|nr:phosphoglycerate dehydrogenase [Bacteroidota bacterium]
MKANFNRSSKSIRVLISDEVHPILMDGLKEAGHTVLYHPGASREEIAGILPDVEAWVLRTGVEADGDLLCKARSIKWIGRAGVGLDNIDLNAAMQMGITCENAGEANADAVGEHTLGLLLMLMNYLGKAFLEVKQGVWLREENRGTELKGKTIGIIGFGNTGSAVAAKLSGFGVKVLAYDKYKQDFGSSNIQECGLNQLQKEADIISFHVPLTEETHHYFNADFLKECQKQVFILNLSRGKIVKTSDLVEGLKSGKVKGAALDVLENERLESLKMEEKVYFDYLRNASNVVLTPHIGGWTQESYGKISTILLNKFLSFSENINK